MSPSEPLFGVQFFGGGFGLELKIIFLVYYKCIRFKIK